MSLIERYRRYWQVKKGVKRLYLWGLCPACNSDAPAIDTCNVCHGDREFPPSPRRRYTLAGTYLLRIMKSEESGNE